MATATLNTTLAPMDHRPGSAGVVMQGAGFVANTGAVHQYYAAPLTGKIIGACVQGSVTSDATKTYLYVITNVTTNKTVTAANQLYDASPVLTAGTKAYLTLSTTAADVACTEGDIIKVSFTGGTGSGDTAIGIYFQGA